MHVVMYLLTFVSYFVLTSINTATFMIHIAHVQARCVTAQLSGLGFSGVFFFGLGLVALEKSKWKPFKYFFKPASDLMIPYYSRKERIKMA